MRKSILIIGLFVFIINNKLSSQSWSAPGSGIGYPFGFGVVYASAVYNGELYASGYFDNASGISANNIAKWNGTTWSPVGQGLVSSDPYWTSVSSLCVYNGELYAAGNFDTAGGIAARNIAKWNGIAWSAVGTISANSIRSLAVYNGELYVAAFFPNINGIEAPIAKWNGVNWSTVGTGIFSLLTSINCLAVYNGSLYAGGGYDSWGGGVPDYNDIAKWDGTSWSLLNSQIGPVYCITAFNGELYAGGYFTSAGGVPANQIAKWNGINWSSVGSGINLYSDGYWSSSVNTLAVYNGSLFAGGYFYHAGDISTNNIAKWDGTNWSGLGQGTDYWVSSFAPTDHGIYVGGWFNYVGNNIVAHKIAKWTDSCAIPPLMPGQINGDQNVCPAVAQTYFIDPVDGAENYTWNLPLGWTGNSTTTSITVYPGTNGGLISVVANNSCGSSIAQTINVTVDPGPQQPGIINGNDTICAGSTQTYFIAPVTGAASYTWNLPAGWSGISNSPTITVQAGSNGGPISVFANNNCASIPQTILITTQITPAAPAFINGNDTVCEGSSQTYFIDPVPGATGYAWDLTFGWAGGLHTDSITIVVDHNGYIDDLISVSAYNNCGNSDMLWLPVKVNHLPYQPDRIYGNNLVCRGSDQTYFIDTVPDATSYTWIVPSGWIGNSNTSSIDVTVGNETGEILVSANNSCGSGAFKSLHVVLDSIPAKPGIIKGNVYVGTGEKHAYSVDITNRPLGYYWTLSGGGNLAVGQSPNKIEIDWQTPGTYVLSVKAVNNCYASSAQTLVIKVLDTDGKDPYHLKLFPNPSSGEFYLKGKRLENKLISVDVFSMSGQLVHQIGKTTGANDYSQLIDLDKMPAGVYAVKIIVSGEAFIKQIVVAR